MRIKKIILIAIILFVGSLCFPYFSYAQSNEGNTYCEVCHTPSDEFREYTNFMIDTITTLKGYKQNKKTLVKNIEAQGLFSSNTLSLSEKIVEGAKSRAAQKLEKTLRGVDAIRMQTILGLHIGTTSISDNIIGFVILFKNRPFMRERQTLLEIDASLNSLIYDLALDNKWQKELDPDVRKELSTVFTNYTNQNDTDEKLFLKQKIIDGKKYSHVLVMLQTFNTHMKSFITWGKSGEGAFSNSMINNKHNLLEDGQGTLRLTLNTDYIKDMEINYLCAEGLSTCNDSYQKFAESIENSIHVGKDITDSRSVIQNALYNFRNTNLGNNQTQNVEEKTSAEIELTDYQIDLLGTVYGIQTEKLTNGQTMKLKDLMKNEKKNTNIINTFIKQAIEYMKGSTKTQEEKDKKKERKAELKKINNNLSEKFKEQIDLEKLDQNVLGNLKQEMSIHLDNIKRKHQKQLHNLAMIDNTDAMIKFREIGTRIHQIQEDIIGARNTDGIIKYLGELCEYQCGNKGNGNCYYSY